MRSPLKQTRAFRLLMALFVARIVLIIVVSMLNSNARPTRACCSDSRTRQGFRSFTILQPRATDYRLQVQLAAWNWQPEL